MSSPYHRRGSTTRPHSDYRSYSARQRILGPSAARVPPAWRNNERYTHQRQQPAPFLNESHLTSLGGGYANLPQQEGSKIYISHLPADVDDVDVQQLLTETIGPLIYSFVVYDVRGMTKMAAVASFVDPAHAAKAVELYNGKVIDGKEPIRVEQVGVNPKARPPPPPPPPAGPSGHRGNFRHNPVASTSRANPPPAANSLLNRVSQAPAPPTSLLARVSARPVRPPPSKPSPQKKPQTQPLNVTPHPPPKPKRVKKGPKRLQKVTQAQTQKVTQQQLENELDQWRNAATDGLGL
ncbi:hypothetical protein BDV93DRAFT_518024, partial [Ceratobasidium sp. AG-I]